MSAWPLTGKPLADLNILLSNWRQYGTFYFIGPDDIDRLFNILTTVGIEVDLDDLGNRPQYWLLQLAIAVGGTTPPTPPCEPCGVVWGPDNTEISYVLLKGDFSTLSIPTLVTQAGFVVSISDNGLLTSIGLPLLQSVNGLEITNNASLVSLVLPALVTANSLIVDVNVSLVNFSIPNFVPTNGVDYFLDSNALSVGSVDGALARFVANPAYVSGKLDLSGGTNSAPSSIAPGSDYDILINRGVNVLVNP